MLISGWHAGACAAAAQSGRPTAAWRSLPAGCWPANALGMQAATVQAVADAAPAGQPALQELALPAPASQHLPHEMADVAPAGQPMRREVASFSPASQPLLQAIATSAPASQHVVKEKGQKETADAAPGGQPEAVAARLVAYRLAGVCAAETPPRRPRGRPRQPRRPSAAGGETCGHGGLVHHGP